MQKTFDYLIVGYGFAGLFFTHELSKSQKTFKVIDTPSIAASQIAAGVYNPVVLKRMTPVWMADIQIKSLIKTIKDIEILLKCKLLYETPVLRIFNDVEEIENWQKKAFGFEINHFLSKQFIELPFPLNTPLKAGKVKQSGRIYADLLLNTYKNFIESHFIEETLNHKDIKPLKEGFQYKEFYFKKIVFCEGYGIKNNPFFNYLPVSSDKGECLIINISPQSKGLKKYILKKKHFLFELEPHQYYVGGTDNYIDINPDITEEAKQELLSDLENMFEGEYTILKHYAAIRPTTHDRRPYLGEHPSYNDMYVFNGLGTRGLMLGSYFSKILYQYIENHIPLPKEVNIERIKLKDN